MRMVVLFDQFWRSSERDTTKTQLKNHVSIHLLISGAPTGDGREFLPTDCDGMY